MKKIAIFGAGGFGREVLQIILDINEIKPMWDLVGFVVDPEFLTSNTVHGYPVYDSSWWLAKNQDVLLIIAIGSPAKRKKIVDGLLRNENRKFATLIHPNAWIGRHVKIDEGVVICSGSQITTDIKIGAHTNIHLGAVIGHDSNLNSYVTIYPNASISGNVTLNQGAEIGTSSVIIPKVNIGKWTIIGAGAVVTKNVANNCIAVGVPAKVIKTHSGIHE